jgi:hypothetical protein
MGLWGTLRKLVGHNFVYTLDDRDDAAVERLSFWGLYCL